MIQKLVWSVLFVALSVALVYGEPQMGNEKDSTTKTVTGCLQKGTEPEGFFIISTKGKHWELYPNNGVSLAEHVGHTVTVEGTVAHRSATQEEKSQPHERKEMGDRKHADLQVSSMKMVSETCK
ncbi:MAG: hypothetical protein LAO09_05760 [Acidobacteriia bacterium]|nr:hypothetical protein [Terriglobia bacterium]